MAKLYHCDAWFLPFEPDEYVDISEVIDIKLEALGCHESQLSNCGRSEGDMVDMARQQSSNRGIEAGVKYAEAFRLVPNLGSVRLNGMLGG